MESDMRNGPLVALYRQYKGQDVVYLGIMRKRFALDLLADVGSLHGPSKDYWMEKIADNKQKQVSKTVEGIEKLLEK